MWIHEIPWSSPPTIVFVVNSIHSGKSFDSRRVCLIKAVFNMDLSTSTLSVINLPQHIILSYKWVGVLNRLAFCFHSKSHELLHQDSNDLKTWYSQLTLISVASHNPADFMARISFLSLVHDLRLFKAIKFVFDIKNTWQKQISIKCTSWDSCPYIDVRRGNWWRLYCRT